MRSLLPLLALCLPVAAYAAGSDSSTPPAEPKCENGQVWDKASESCTDVKDSRLDDDTLYQATREFAYAGQYQNALRTLAAMSDANDSRVLTYRGFIARKTGDFPTAMGFYTAALTQDPDNLLARSYLGQGLVAEGDIEAARLQLAEIRQRGGRESWPEWALDTAIKSGKTYAY